jgi:hypothetical protein
MNGSGSEQLFFRGSELQLRHYGPCAKWALAPEALGQQVDREFVAMKGSNMATPDIKFQPGQTVRVNLAGLQVQGVLFHAAVTDAVGQVIRQTGEEPPKFLVKLLFSFKGVTEVEVPADRVRAA